VQAVFYAGVKIARIEQRPAPRRPARVSNGARKRSPKDDPHRRRSEASRPIRREESKQERGMRYPLALGREGMKRSLPPFKKEHGHRRGEGRGLASDPQAARVEMEFRSACAICFVHETCRRAYAKTARPSTPVVPRKSKSASNTRALAPRKTAGRRQASGRKLASEPLIEATRSKPTAIQRFLRAVTLT